MSTGRKAVGVFLVVALAVFGPSGASAQGAPPADLAPGAVLATEPVHVSLGPAATPVTATRVTYRTTDQLGHPEADVTTVIAPSPLSGVLPRIVGYLSFYDGLGAKCDPSNTLTGGDAGPATDSQATEEELLIAFYVANGWIVTVPDFEGPHLHWMAGRESGQSTLDAIRATESVLGLGTTTQVALSGYSGGAVAADWASELAPSYAPELTLSAVAEGGIPVDYAHLFSYVSGDAVFGASMPGILLGLARAYHYPLQRYLSPYGKKLVHAESDTCITEDFGRYPGLTMAKLFRARYRDPFAVPGLARIFNDQIMGRAPGHPLVPLLMGIGDIDGFGDGVMRTADVETLAREYCRDGVAVEFRRYGAGHEAAGIYFDPQSAAFFQGRFNGIPFKGNCGSIPPGDPLTPLPVER
ncbi:MAG TPA: lipase family protein [Mycobacteriales bacterium]|nr:lipase family protein [Mycobacteriales bacterium]HWB66400.1 lipase family protein [Mycobacteriales bacterium]